MRYNGEWAGPWERYLVDDVVPWVDTHLPTHRDRDGRTIAGLSAGGFGAADIGLRAPRLFGTIESWSGYFHPLHDGPFEHAIAGGAGRERSRPPRRRAGPHPACASGRGSSSAAAPRTVTGSREQESVDFAHELQRLGVRHTLVLETDRGRQYGLQLSAGLVWALARLKLRLPDGGAATRAAASRRREPTRRRSRARPGRCGRGAGPGQRCSSASNCSFSARKRASPLPT